MSALESLIDQDRDHHVHGQTSLRQHQETGPTAMVTEGHGVASITVPITVFSVLTIGPGPAECEGSAAATSERSPTVRS